ncbi:Proline iminopeptidase, partial [Meyerozyma sp. JA9]
MSYTVIDSYRVKDLLNTQIEFRFPLSYAAVNSHFKYTQDISVVGTLTQSSDADLHSNLVTIKLPENPKIATYLQGGPGFPCTQPLTNSSFTKELLTRGFSVFYMDHRGTGFSTPLEAGTIGQLESPEAYSERVADFLTNFRADNIVEDLERFRKILLGSTKWTLFGESFGGFCSFTYLSRYPESLEAVLVTGGNYERTSERNRHYYSKYPQDVPRIRQIATYLFQNDVKLPNGGTLSVKWFQQLGLSFGGSGGTDTLHQIVTKFHHELTHFRSPTYQTLFRIESQMSFDTNILYALFQECIYCDGNYSPSFWSADRLRKLPQNQNFMFSPAMKEPLYFTGEMVCKSMFDDYTELRPFKLVADSLHNRKKWTQLYEVDKLKQIKWEQVPTVAATYFYDQYVDFETTMQIKRTIFGFENLRQYITSEFFHDGILVDAAKVLGSLFDLLDTEYVQQGLLSGISLSETSANTVLKALKVANISCVELELSFFTRDIVEDGVLKVCSENNIPIIAYSPVGRGMLTDYA